MNATLETSQNLQTVEKTNTPIEKSQEKVDGGKTPAKPLSERVKGILSIFKKEKQAVEKDPDKILKEIADGNSHDSKTNLADDISEDDLENAGAEQGPNSYEEMTPQQLNEELKGLISLFPTKEDRTNTPLPPNPSLNEKSTSPLDNPNHPDLKTHDRGVIFKQLRDLAPHMKMSRPGLEYLFHVLDMEFDMGISKILPGETVDGFLQRSGADLAKITDATNPKSGGPFDEKTGKGLEQKLFKQFHERSSKAEKDHKWSILKGNGFDKKWAAALAQRESESEKQAPSTSTPRPELEPSPATS